jgi:two-component system, cell cycle response regulator DivK
MPHLRTAEACRHRQAIATFGWWPAGLAVLKGTSMAIGNDALTPAGADGALVLIVDDYDDSREMYAEFLELSGFRVCQARDGGQGLAKARQLHPDVILMDLSLPETDGVEVIKQLKLDSTTKAIPVIALSGHNETDLAGKQSPWDYFLNKPCPPEELVRGMRQALSKGSGVKGRH